MHLNLLPTQLPLENILEVQDSSEDRNTELLVLDNEPYNIYQTDNPQFTESELAASVDVNLISYDIDELDTTYSSNRTTFVCTDSAESNLYLAQPVNKVKKTWYNQMAKSELNVDPKFALDNACYQMETTLENTAANVIQATYLGPLTDIPHKPILTLDTGSLVQAHLPSGLKLTTLVDTGCYKTILNRKVLQKNMYHFKNFKKVLMKEEHEIKLANGLIIKTDGLIALQIVIQNYLFQFLVLVTTLSEDFDFILGLESLIQLEANYSLLNNTLQLEDKCIPLYPLKDMILPANGQIPLELTGQLPLTFS